MKGGLPLLAILAILWSATLPAAGNIPPGDATPDTACGEYVATPAFERIEQWINTFQSGLIKNPELEPEVWTCVMDLSKMTTTDEFMMRECRKDTNAVFEELAFKALSYHLDRCGIGVNRSS